jgi:hypothetical protein
MSVDPKAMAAALESCANFIDAGGYGDGDHELAHKLVTHARALLAGEGPVLSSGEGNSVDAGAAPLVAGQPDYTAMDGPELLRALRDDGSKWATAFCQHAKKLGYGEIADDWMTGWFANAIESSHDLRMRRTLERPSGMEIKS